MVLELGKGFDILITVNLPSINYEVEKFCGEGNFSIWHRQMKDLLTRSSLGVPLESKEA